MVGYYWEAGMGCVALCGIAGVVKGKTGARVAQWHGDDGGSRTRR